MKWPAWELRKPTEAQRRRVRVMWTIFGVPVVALALASLLGAPEWLKSSILGGMVVTWLVVGIVMQVRDGR